MPPLSDFYFITINRPLQYSFSPFMAPLRQNMPGRRCKTENSCLFAAEGNKKDKIAAQICLPRRAGYDIINAVKNKWPCGQAVKTEPSQGSIPGSIPGKVTKKTASEFGCCFFWSCHRIEPVVRVRSAATKLCRRLPFMENGRLPCKVTFFVRFFSW